MGSDVKTCTKCGEVKPPDSFHKNAASADGLMPRCKACIAAYGRAYRTRNAEKLAVKRADYLVRNAEANRARAREWARDHPDLAQARNRRWAAANQEKVAQIRRAQSKRQVKELSDRYVRAALADQGFRSPPPEIIDLKREQLRLRRLAKKLHAAADPKDNK